MSILYKTTRFADTFTGDKETNVRVQLLSWDTLDTKAFVEYLATKYNLSKGEAYKSLSIVLEGMDLKKRISAAGFEKYNPKKHNKRKY